MGFPNPMYAMDGRSAFFWTLYTIMAMVKLNSKILVYSVSKKIGNPDLI